MTPFGEIHCTKLAGPQQEFKLAPLGGLMPRHGCPTVGVDNCSAWRNPMRSSEQEGVEPDVFRQGVCRKF